jgi:hypothetical protein
MPGVSYALELLLDPGLEQRVRQAWDLLAAAGLPSQARHPHPTNRPHVTLTVADELDPAAITPELGALPLPMDLDGVVVLGGRRRTVAWLVVPTAPLLRLHHGVHRAARVGPSGSPLLRPDCWVPHVTLASRLDGEDAAAVVAALGALPAASGTANAARAYDTLTRTTSKLSR